MDLREVRLISHDHFIEWTRKAHPREWDVILSRRCNPGETAVVPSELKCALGQNLVLLRADGKHVVPKFLRWLVRSPEWWEQVQTFINVGAVFDSLRCADITNFKLTIPPLDEQRAIAHILGTLDDRIELNRRMNETLEAMARAIFKSWFVDFDPVRAKAEGRDPGLPKKVADLFPDRFEDSELGEIPAGWEVKRLGEIADVNWGDTNVTKKSYVASGFVAYSAKGPDGFLPYADFDRSGVIISAIGENCGMSWLAHGKWSCIKNTLRFWETEDNISTEYLYHWTLGKNFWPRRGSAQPFISQGDARAIKVLIPCNKLAKKFGDVVKPNYAKADSNNSESRTLAALRDTLLPKLISGELRVKDTERFVARAIEGSDSADRSGRREKRRG